MSKIILLIGNGKLSKALQKHLKKYQVIIFDENNINSISSYKGNILIDCSTNDGFNFYYEYLLKHRIPTIIAATNHTKKQLNQIKQLSSILPLFKSDNFSVGITLINKIISQNKQIIDLYDVFLHEYHHKQKLDSPSGTSKKINELLDFKINITSIRSHNIIGKHNLILIGEDEEITFTHQILSRDVFAKGILKAIDFIQKKENGYYTMEDLVNEI